MKKRNWFHGAARSLFVVFSLVVVSVSGQGSKAFYVDPVNGLDSNDGSLQKPWRNIQTVINSGLVKTNSPASFPYNDTVSIVAINKNGVVNGGDTIYLMNGNHGGISISRSINYKSITIAAMNVHKAIVDNVVISASRKWNITGLTVTFPETSSVSGGTMVRIESHGWGGPTRDIIVENCNIFSCTGDPYNWTSDEWNKKARTGISVSSVKNVQILNNDLFNISHGISVSGDSCLVKNNKIINYSCDGMRGIGNYLRFEKNVVKNSYATSGNHNDGFQSWTVGSDGKVGTGVNTGLQLIGNTIVALGYDVPPLPFETYSQGIGCFDGFWDSALVVNNLVITNHWHGITFSGIRNSIIANNTVVGGDTASESTWIRVSDHKDGRKSQNCIVANNLAFNINVAQEKGLVTNNLVVTEDSTEIYYRNWPKHDLRLKRGTPAVNGGSKEYAPDTDINGVPRPGASISIGAFQFQDYYTPPKPFGVRIQSGNSLTK